MDFGWPAGLPGGSHGGESLNLLSDNLLLDLDDKTLQCLLGGPLSVSGLSQLPAAAPSGGDEGAGPSSKRQREEEASANNDDDEDDEEGGRGRGGKCGAKKGKAAVDAAAAKACREKARRERLNDCFDELARLCDPSGKHVRTDRVSIVQDAIRVLGQLRVENNQLRQLNKFLEERMGHFERARAQNMFQQAQQQALHQQAGSLDASTSAAAAVGVVQQQHLLVAGGEPAQQQQHESLALARASSSGLPRLQTNGLGTAGLAPHPALAGLPPGTVLVQLPHGSSVVGAHQLYAVKQEHLGGGSLAAVSVQQHQQQQQPNQQQQQALMGLPDSAPQVSWLPAPDFSQDQRLRPPAA